MTIKYNVKLHDKQLEVATDTHRFKIICAGRRWGKSVLSRLIVLKWAWDNPNGLYWIVSPTYRQGKQNHWLQLKAEIPMQWIVKINEVELMIVLKNGAMIQLKGADNPDSLRGIKLNGLVIDEIASIRSWAWLWHEVLRATLTDFEAPAIFISTPKGFNHFYELFNLGIDNSQYKSWQFTSYDNPYIPKHEIDQAKIDMNEDHFQQEYMADFRKATGLAHKPFDRRIHLIEPFDIPSHWQYARGFDYGSANPTASTRVAIDTDSNWFIDSCYKDSQRSIEEHAKAILAQDYGKGLIPIWGDPSGLQWVKEFRKYNLFIEPANKSMDQAARGWVEHCIERVNNLLKPRPGHVVEIPGREGIKDAPKLFIFNTPENMELVREMERLEWRTTTAGSTIPVLDEETDSWGEGKGHFDLLAALRYLAVSWSPRPKTKEVPFDAEHRTFGISSMDAYR